MSNSPAYQRFLSSMELDFEKWHDGIGFDLMAIREMTAVERRAVCSQLNRAMKTWREIEALEAFLVYWSKHPTESPDTLDEAINSIKEATSSAADRDTRLAAIEVLYTQGLMPELESVLANEICELDRIGDGSVRALLLAERYPSEVVKQALLYASQKENDCAMHCAALLLYLSGKAESAFDWSLRPFLLRLAVHSTSCDRTVAVDELLAMTGMTLQEPKDFLPKRKPT